MVIARNSLREVGLPGWTQRSEMDEYGYYRELQAVHPGLHVALSDGYASKKVWDWNAIKRAWPQLRDRALEGGSDAIANDLVIDVEAEGTALPDGIRIPAKGRPRLTLQ
jgi:hypothetical protein